jgi:hypothetical protein
MKELMSLWPAVDFLHGRPRHPESQGAVEKANDILCKKLSKWMEATDRRDWSTAVNLVTCEYQIYAYRTYICLICLLTLLSDAMNLDVSSATGVTPYEVVFGQRANRDHGVIHDLIQQGMSLESDVLNIILINGEAKLASFDDETDVYVDSQIGKIWCVFYDNIISNIY